MKLKSYIVFCIGCCLMTSSLLAAPTENSNAEGTLIQFNGHLQDPNQQPISGVFPLKVELFKKAGDSKSEWESRRFVAVENGKYQVTLGKAQKLSRKLIEQRPWVSIKLQDGTQLLRDRLILGNQNISPSKAAKPANSKTDKRQKIEATDKTKKLLKKVEQKEEITYANIADRALKADHAKVAEKADKVGDLTAKKIKNKTESALDKLGKHMTDPNAHDSAGGLSLGTDHRVPEKAGGSGGTPFERECPPNHVVTGIRGNEGKVVDQLTIICTPLN